MSMIIGICETPLKGSEFLEEVLDEHKELYSLFENFCMSAAGTNIETIYPKISYNAGIEDTLDLLNKYPDKIKFIHFSGHYEDGALIFSDTTTDAINGLFPKINKCDNLLCVFLNGCTTKEAKEYLTNIPIVIISNQPIYDRFAKDVSIGFYTKLLRYISDNGNIKRGDDLKFVSRIFDDSLNDSLIKFQNMLDKDQKLLEKLESKLSDGQNSLVLKREHEKLRSYIKLRGRVPRKEKKAREDIYTVIVRKPKVLFEVDTNAFRKYSPNRNIYETNKEVNPKGTLPRLYKIFPFIFKDNISTLASEPFELSLDRFLNQKVILEKYLVLVKCVVNAIWWDLKNQYSNDTFTTNINEIKALLLNIISEDFDKHHEFDYENDVYVFSRSVKSTFEIINKTEKKLIEKNNFTNSLFNELEELEQSISKAIRLFFTPTSEITDENEKQKLFYLCDKEINHIILKSSFLRNVRLRSVYDIQYFNYPFKREDKKLVFNFSNYQFDGMFDAKTDSSEKINLDEINNFHSTIELIKTDESNDPVINLSPFIIDRNTLEKSDKKRIDFYYLNSFELGRDGSYVSFENVGGSKKSILSISEISNKNGEIKEHISAYYKFISNDDK